MINWFFGLFNIVLGSYLTLVGFKVYVPKSVQEKEGFYAKYGMLFKVGGVGMLLWGLFKLPIW
tara:strand:- start:666 stop:854 length:189 start_codon:yes stop_codon:yes gene_type:complete